MQKSISLALLDITIPLISSGIAYGLWKILLSLLGQWGEGIYGAIVSLAGAFLFIIFVHLLVGERYKSKYSMSYSSFAKHAGFMAYLWTLMAIIMVMSDTTITVSALEIVLYPILLPYFLAFTIISFGFLSYGWKQQKV